MPVKVAINGFGRIGRCFLRSAFKSNTKLDIVAINDLTDSKTLAYLLKYDTAYGPFDGTVGFDEKNIIINGKAIPTFCIKDPATLPWGDFKPDFVLESTGVFRKTDDLKKHIQAGAARVMLSAPPKGDVDFMVVLGVNDKLYDPSKHFIISNASCTTNCLAPVVKVLVDEFGFERGYMCTVHAYTNDQRILDFPHTDFRRARTAAANIIPTTTGAAKAVGKVIPEVAGKIDGASLRVPVITGSVVNLTASLGNKAGIKWDDLPKEEIKAIINKAMKKAAEGSLKGILQYTEDLIVSSDIIGNASSSIFDGDATQPVAGNMVNMLAWYDNEWGYSSRLVDVIAEFGSR